MPGLFAFPLLPYCSDVSRPTHWHGMSIPAMTRSWSSGGSRVDGFDLQVMAFALIWGMGFQTLHLINTK